MNSYPTNITIENNTVTLWGDDGSKVGTAPRDGFILGEGAQVYVTLNDGAWSLMTWPANQDERSLGSIVDVAGYRAVLVEVRTHRLSTALVAEHPVVFLKMARRLDLGFPVEAQMGQVASATGYPIEVVRKTLIWFAGQ